MPIYVLVLEVFHTINVLICVKRVACKYSYNGPYFETVDLEPMPGWHVDPVAE